MAPEVLLYLLCGWQPLPCCHAPGFPYQQLPTETICELCYHQCEADRQRIVLELQFVGGWQRIVLLDKKQQAMRLERIWYSAWWIAWNKASNEQRDEWAEVLCDMIGQMKFFTGEIPLPLSLK